MWDRITGKNTRRNAIGKDDSQALLASFSQLPENEIPVSNILKLIDQGANPYLADDDGISPFYYIYKTGNIALLQQIQEKAPNEEAKALIINLASAKLQIEIEKEVINPRVINSLLDAGASFTEENTKFAQDMLLEQSAKDIHDVDKVEIALKMGAKIDLKGTDDLSPLENAYNKSNSQLIDTFVEYDKETMQRYAYNKILEIAKSKETEFDHDVVQSLLKATDPYSRGNHKASLFEAAYYTGNMQLFDQMEPENHKDILNNLRLIKEAQRSEPNLNIIEAYLKSGADPTFVDINGKTAIGEAIANNNIELTYLLYEKIPGDKKLPYKDKLQESLQKALLKGAQEDSLNSAKVKYLLDRGADPYLEMDGKSAFEYLYSRKNDKLIELIQDDKPNLQLHATLQLQEELQRDDVAQQRIAELLKQGADPFKRDEQGPIYKYAKERGNWKALILMSDAVEGKEDNSYIKNDLNFGLQEELKKESPEIDLVFDLYSRTPKKEENKNQVNDLIIQKIEEYSRDNDNDSAAKLFNRIEEVGLPVKEYQEIKTLANIKKFSERVAQEYWLANPGVLVREELERVFSEEKINSWSSNNFSIASEQDLQEYIKDHREQLYSDNGKVFPEPDNFAYQTMSKAVKAKLKKQGQEVSEKSVLQYMIDKGITYSPETERELLEIQFDEKQPGLISPHRAVALMAGEENFQRFQNSDNKRIITEIQITQEMGIKKREDFAKFLASEPKLSENFTENSSSKKVFDIALNYIETNPELLNKAIDLLPKSAKQEAAEYLKKQDISRPKFILAIDDSLKLLTGNNNLSPNAKKHLQEIADLITDQDREDLVSGKELEHSKVISLCNNMNSLQDTKDWQNLPSNFKAQYNATLVQAINISREKNREIIQKGDINQVAEATKNNNEIFDLGAKSYAYRIDRELDEDPRLQSPLDVSEVRKDANTLKEKEFKLLERSFNDPERFGQFLAAKPYLGADPSAGGSVGAKALDYAVSKISDNPQILKDFSKRILDEYGKEAAKDLRAYFSEEFQHFDENGQKVINEIVTATFKDRSLINMKNLDALWIRDQKEAEKIISNADKSDISDALVGYAKGDKSNINKELYEHMYGKLEDFEHRIGPVIQYVAKDNGEIFKQLLKDKNLVLLSNYKDSQAQMKKAFSKASFEDKEIINTILIQDGRNPIIDRDLLVEYATKFGDKVPGYCQNLVENNRAILSFSNNIRESRVLNDQANKLIDEIMAGNPQDTSPLYKQIEQNFESLSLEEKITANEFLIARDQKPIVTAQYLLELSSSPENAWQGKAAIGLLSEENKADLAIMIEPMKGINDEFRKDLSLLIENTEERIRVALKDDSLEKLGVIIEEFKDKNPQAILNSNGLQEAFNEKDFEKQLAFNNFLIEKGLEPEVNVEFIKKLWPNNSKKLNEILEKTSNRSHERLLEEIKNAKDVDSNLVAKVAVSASKEDLNRCDFILEDPKKISQLNAKNLSEMVELYNPKNHSPSFLTKLIDSHDVKSKKRSDVVDEVYKKLTRDNTYFMNLGSKKDNDLKTSIDSYLKTKHSFFKKFFPDQEKKLKKRAAQIVVYTQDEIPLKSLEEMYKNSTSHAARVHKLIDTMPAKQVQKLMQEMVEAEENKNSISPELVVTIYNRAAKLNENNKGVVELGGNNQDFANIILKNEQMIGKLSFKALENIIEHYDPNKNHSDKILERYLQESKKKSILSGAKILEAIGIKRPVHIELEDLKEGINKIRQNSNESDKSTVREFLKTQQKMGKAPATVGLKVGGPVEKKSVVAH